MAGRPPNFQLAPLNPCFFLRFVVKPLGNGQPVLTLERLRRLDSLERLMLPIPDLSGQRHATGDDMDVVVIGILVAYSNPLGIRREAHFF